MTTVPDTRPHTSAVVDVLQDALDAVPVGLGKAPRKNAPYVAVYPAPSLLFGPLNDPHADGELVYRVISVGAGPEQAEHNANIVRRALLDPAALRERMVEHDRSIANVTVDTLGGLERDDDVQPSVWFISDAFRLLTTPGTAGS